MMILRAAKRCMASFLLTVACLAGSGCEYIGILYHYDLSTQQLEQYKGLQVVTVEQRKDGNYRSLGEISGVSCSRRGESISEADAFDQVRLRASLAGARAVSSPVCTHSNGTDWNNNCWQSIVCVSEILVRPGEEPQLKPLTSSPVE